jgi:hypothetical protein
MVCSGVWGKLIHEKSLKLKISWHYPFKHRLSVEGRASVMGESVQGLKIQGIDDSGNNVQRYLVQGQFIMASPLLRVISFRNIKGTWQ